MVGKMKQVSTTHRQEEESLTILRSSLNSKEVFLQDIGGVNPSTDGVFHFLDKDSRPRTFQKDNRDQVAKTEYQLKSTNTKGKKTYSFSIEDLRYYSICSHPVFVFLVDIQSKISYWELIDSNYIKDILKINNIDTTTAKTKTVHFTDKKIVGSVTTEVIFNDFNKTPSNVSSLTEVPSTDTKIEQDELNKYKDSLAILVQQDIEKILDLEALIFFHSPFLVSDTTVFEPILSKSGLDSVEFEFYTGKLVTSGIMTRVGDVLSVTDSRAAQGLLSELINKKGIEYVYG